MIYLDHQATTPTDLRVVDAMLPWMHARAANPHSTTHSFGIAARDAVEEARAQVAALINAQPYEIIFTSGATEATNIALRGLLAEGKGHAIASAIEHNCVRETLADLEQRGLKVTRIPCDSDGLVNPADVAVALTKKTRLVTVMAANNEAGAIQDIEAVAELCRGANVAFHSDAAQAVGKIAIDVQRTPIDLMSISAHKLYGPQGIGALFCRDDLFKRLRPIMTGGGQERGLRPGTLPTALCVGMGVACDLARAEMEAEARRLVRLRSRFIDLLAGALTGIRINGSMDRRLPGNMNVMFEGVDAEALLARLPDIAMSTGSACSSSAMEPSHVLLAMGLSPEQAQSSVRIGLGRSTTEREVETAVERLARAVSAVRGLTKAADATVDRGKRAGSR